MRLFYEEAHYVVLTGIEKDGIRMFDPYYEEEPFKEEGVQLVLDQPFSHNRIVPACYFNQESLELYAFGPYEMREAVLLFNNETMITPEKSIEYFI